VKTVRAVKKRYGDQHLAIGCRWQLQIRTSGDGGFQKKLTTARRGITHHAITAPRKGHSHQGPARTMLQEEPQQDKQSERDIRRNRNAEME
jgi:hypothetical protein